MRLLLTQHRNLSLDASGNLGNFLSGHAVPPCSPELNYVTAYPKRRKPTIGRTRKNGRFLFLPACQCINKASVPSWIRPHDQPLVKEWVACPRQAKPITPERTSFLQRCSVPGRKPRTLSRRPTI